MRYARHNKKVIKIDELIPDDKPPICTAIIGVMTWSSPHFGNFLCRSQKGMGTMRPMRMDMGMITYREPGEYRCLPRAPQETASLGWKGQNASAQAGE